MASYTARVLVFCFTYGPLTFTSDGNMSVVLLFREYARVEAERGGHNLRTQFLEEAILSGGPAYTTDFFKRLFGNLRLEGLVGDLAADCIEIATNLAFPIHVDAISEIDVLETELVPSLMIGCQRQLCSASDQAQRWSLLHAVSFIW